MAHPFYNPTFRVNSNRPDSSRFGRCEIVHTVTNEQDFTWPCMRASHDLTQVVGLAARTPEHASEEARQSASPEQRDNVASRRSGVNKQEKSAPSQRRKREPRTAALGGGLYSGRTLPRKFGS